jgi:dimethylargininase
MKIALTHAVPKGITQCELTYLTREPIDYQAAVAQHAAYLGSLRRAGVEVIELTANSDYPDGCFVEDTAVVVDELAVMARMGVESRRGEVSEIERVLSNCRSIARIEAPATLEGGDIVVAGRKVFAGLSPRTSRAGVSALATLLKPHGYQVVGVPINDCLHLKSACTLLGGDTMIANPQWFDLSEFGGFNIINVVEDEPWAANALRVGDVVFVGAEFPRTAQKIRNAGFAVETIEISEFLKAEAGLTCSSIIFDAV